MAAPVERNVGNIENLLSHERMAIDEWANAPMTIESYRAGSYGSRGSRNYYEYPPGRRLLIGEHQVMDTSEAPWAQATVDRTFDSPGIRRLKPEHKIKVLERGAGLNIAGSRIIQKMYGRGSGEYHVIELNKEVADMTREWKEREDATLRQWSTQQGINLDIQIYVHEGDAREVTRELVAAREKFNIIISDTFPLTPDEMGKNDIEDLDVMKRALYKGDEGVFSFFAYYPGWNNDAGKMGTIRSYQQSLLNRHFQSVNFREVSVNPAAGYDYLFEDGKPTRSLPYVICSEKR